MLEYKSIPFEIKEVVPTEGGGWEIAGYASTFGGEPDSYGDVIVKGAFLESLTKGWPKLLFEHYEPIGKTLEIREDDRGLFGRWAIIDTTKGTDAYKLARGGVLDSMSIGYFTLEYEYRQDGVRLLQKVDLPEVSVTATPANRNAVITDVKSRPFDRHTQDVQVALREFLDRCKAGSAQRAAEGRPISDARKSALGTMSGSLRSVADELDALHVPPPPAERIVIGAELRRRRYQAAGVTLERPAP
jgi:HK97 family phage prohead protease